MTNFNGFKLQLKGNKLYQKVRFLYHFWRSFWSEEAKEIIRTFGKTTVPEDVEYIYGMYRSFVDNYKRHTGNTISGKNILELGPGVSLAVSLMMKDSGAQKVHAVDPFLTEFTPSYHIPLYESVKEKIRNELPNIEPYALDISIKNRRHESDGVTHHRCGTENMYSVHEDSIDIVFSNAVLEHLTDPSASFSELSRIMKSGGYGLHQIDFRYHRDMQNSLDFLLLTHAEQKRLLLVKGWFAHGNGWRHSEYIELFKQSGFEVISAEPNMFADDTYMKEFLPKLRASNSPHRDWPEEDLRVLSAYFVVRKK